VSRRPLAVAAVALSALALSACGTSLHGAKTYTEHGRQDGALADVGGRTGVAVRDLHVEPPATGSQLDQGSTAFVTGGLVNDGSTPDALLSASSDVATSATLTVGGQPVTSVAIPALGAAPQDWAVQLDGLTQATHVAEYVGVTLVFEHAGRITLQVPVRAGDNGLPSRSPEQDPYAAK
jgi:copper(I)-binding protein